MPQQFDRRPVGRQSAVPQFPRGQAGQLAGHLVAEIVQVGEEHVGAGRRRLCRVGKWDTHPASLPQAGPSVMPFDLRRLATSWFYHRSV
jgi:hypothetical protein